MATRRFLSLSLALLIFVEATHVSAQQPSVQQTPTQQSSAQQTPAMSLGLNASLALKAAKYASAGGSLPTITIANPAAWIDTKANIPSNLASDHVVITSAAPGSAPQIYLGASVAASAQAAVKSDCVQNTSPNCQSAVASAINPGSALSIQARFAPIILFVTALLMLMSIVLQSSRVLNSDRPPQVINLQPDVVSSLASVQMSSSVVIVTASNDPSPITGSIWPSSSNGATITSTPTVGSISLSTATASSGSVNSGDVIIMLPTQAAAPIASLFPATATGSSCVPVATGSLKKRADYNWEDSIPAAIGLWAIFQENGELQEQEMLLLLQVLRAFSAINLPKFISQVTSAIQSVMDAGQQLKSRILDGLVNFQSAAILYILTFDFRGCLDIDSDRLVIPMSAIDYLSDPITASQTSSDCPAPSLAPNCDNCGGQLGTSICKGVATASDLWKGCTCHAPEILAATVDTSVWSAGFNNLHTLPTAITTTTSAPLPSISIWNRSGKDQCNLGLEKSTCQKAISHYDLNRNYTDYNSEVENPAFGYACTALFTCPKASCPPEGIPGSQVIDRINRIWTIAGLCGSITYTDGIMVTINACNKPCKRYNNGQPA